MKIWAYVALAAIIAGFLTWGYNSIYDAGFNAADLECQSEKKEEQDFYIEELNKVRTREMQAQQAADNIARIHYATITAEVEKNADLQRKLDEPAIEKCSKDDAGNDIAYLSDSSVRVLNSCSQAAALPEASEKQGFVTKEKVTTTDLARYTCFAIGQYNRCAAEVNSAIEEQSIIGEK